MVFASVFILRRGVYRKVGGGIRTRTQSLIWVGYEGLESRDLIRVQLPVQNSGHCVIRAGGVQHPPHPRHRTISNRIRSPSRLSLSKSGKDIFRIVTCGRSMSIG